MSYQITRDRRRNRVYFRVPGGLYVPGARQDGDLQWFGVADVPRQGIAAFLDGLVAAQAIADREKAAYQAVMSEIPVEYRRRHGALYGGTVTIGGESDEIFAPAFGTLRQANWERIAERIMRATGGLIDGRVKDRNTLYRTNLVDGRLVYREVAEHSFGDDMRESYWFPADLFAAVCAVEIKARGITPQSAAGWLSQYRGCVDTELYEFAVLGLSAPKETR